MKFINQLDYPDVPYITRTKLEGEACEIGKTTTVKSSACGLCSSIIVADRLIPNCEFGLQDAIELSYSTEANHHIGTDYIIYAPAFAEKLGLSLKMITDPFDKSAVEECLKTGGAVVAHVGGDRKGYTGVFSHNGHYIAVIGVEPDGRFAVLDPAFTDQKFSEEGREGKVEVKNGCIALCDFSVLAEDTSSRSPSYFLFHRK